MRMQERAHAAGASKILALWGNKEGLRATGWRSAVPVWERIDKTRHCSSKQTPCWALEQVSADLRGLNSHNTVQSTVQLNKKLITESP